MFDGSTTVETGAESVGGGRAAWRELDRQFRSLAKRRGALDHEELALIREAIEVQLWRELGMVSIREYLERRMGYTPGVASERVRVAEALEAMPALEQRARVGRAELQRGPRDHAHRDAPDRARVARGVSRQDDEGDHRAARRARARRPARVAAQARPADEGEDPQVPAARRGDPPAVPREARERDGRARRRARGARGDGARVPARRVGATSKSAPTQIAISMCPSCKVARQNGAGRRDRDLAGGVRARGVRCAVARQRRWRARACRAGRDTRDARSSCSRATSTGAACRGAGRRGTSRSTTSCIASTAARTSRATSCACAAATMRAPRRHADHPRHRRCARGDPARRGACGYFPRGNSAREHQRSRDVPDRRRARAEDARVHEGRRETCRARRDRARRAPRPREPDQGRAETLHLDTSPLRELRWPSSGRLPRAGLAAASRDSLHVRRGSAGLISAQRHPNHEPVHLLRRQAPLPHMSPCQRESSACSVKALPSAAMPTSSSRISPS